MRKPNIADEQQLLVVKSIANALNKSLEADCVEKLAPDIDYTNWAHEPQLTLDDYYSFIRATSNSYIDGPDGEVPNPAVYYSLQELTQEGRWPDRSPQLVLSINIYTMFSREQYVDATCVKTFITGLLLPFELPKFYTERDEYIATIVNQIKPLVWPHLETSFNLSVQYADETAKRFEAEGFDE
jgi:hypothetical protein